METTTKQRRSSKIVVKETIDFIYEILSNNPGGYELNPASLGRTERMICTILVKRGIISKDRARGKGTRYQWVATMHPTKVLYGSVHAELCAVWERKHQKAKEIKEKNEVAPAQPKVQEKQNKDEGVQNTGHNIGFVVLEYNQKQHAFHDNDIRVDALGKLYTEHPLGSFDWEPIAVVKDRDFSPGFLEEYHTFLETLKAYKPSLEQVELTFRFNVNEEFLFGDKDINEFNYEQLKTIPFFKQLEPPVINLLQSFSDQELWDELKRRGYSIEENRLVIIKKAYLN